MSASPIHSGHAGPALRPAAFLDRDGTLTVESEWVRRGQDLVLAPGAAEAVRTLADAGFVVVLVTNQSAVARGLIDERELEEIHTHLRALLAGQGARLDAIYACPHHPDEGAGPWTRACECRKPKPGLLLRAARELRLDLARSWMIGDARRDLEAGWAAGTRVVLVATGKGARERELLLAGARQPEHYAPDVLAAARWVAARGAQGK